MEFEGIEKIEKIEVKKERVYKRKVSMWHGFGFITGLLSFLLISLFMSSVDAKETLPLEENKVSTLPLEENKEEVFLSEKINTMLKLEERKKENFIINQEGLKIHIINTKYETFLMDKYEVPTYLRNYTTKLCRYYNIELTKFLGMVQIESWWGQHKNYNKFSDERTYGSNKEYADIGLAQLSSRYFDSFEKEHFNPEVISLLGYERNVFDARDDIVNLQVAASYFCWLQNYFNGDIESSLIGYNAGPFASRIPQKSILYTKAIMNNYKYIEQAK